MKNIELKIPALRFPEFSDEWEEKKLGEIGTTYNGLSGKTAEDFGLGKPYIQYKQIFDNSKIDINKCGFVNIVNGEKQNEVVYGDILFTTSSETPHEVGFSSVILDEVKNTYLNSFCFGFRPNSLTELYPSFSRYLFRSETVRKDIITLAQGSTRYNMSKIEFLKIGTFIPHLDEQCQIADFLSAVDKRLQLLKDKKTKLEEYKRGVMQRIFSQELRFTRPDGSAYEDWEEKKLGEVCELQSGFAFKSNDFQKKGIPIIRISNISNVSNMIDTSNMVYHSRIENEEKYLLCKGDLIVALSGATTGKSCIYNLEYNGYANQRVGVFRVTKHIIYSYLVQFVFSIIFQLQLNSILVAGAQPNVSPKDIELFTIPLPSLEEQTQIANFLSSIDVKIEKLSEQIEATEDYKKGLLQQMFV